MTFPGGHHPGVLRRRFPLFLAGLLALASSAVLAAACGSGGDGQSPSPSPEQPTSTPFQIPHRPPTAMELPARIAVTLPLFEEFAKAAGGDNVDVISLLPTGADPHTYQLTDADIHRMKGVDFFFLNGLGLDSRLRETIESNRDGDAYVIPFAPNIRSPQGGDMTAEEAGDNAHLWLDPSLAYVYVEIIADELIIYDGVHQDSYNANFTEFKQRMLDLQDELYARMQAVPADRRKIITYHNSLDHFARKFDLEIAGYAVEAPGDTPAPDTVARLAGIVRDRGIPAVFAEHGYGDALMRQVADQAGVPLCTLYTDILAGEGVTYEEMMRANADEIVRCLGAQ